MRHFYFKNTHVQIVEAMRYRYILLVFKISDVRHRAGAWFSGRWMFWDTVRVDHPEQCFTSVSHDRFKTLIYPSVPS